MKYVIDVEKLDKDFFIIKVDYGAEKDFLQICANSRNLADKLNWIRLYIDCVYNELPEVVYGN